MSLVLVAESLYWEFHLCSVGFPGLTLVAFVVMTGYSSFDS